jgi:hypothetical protein
MKRNLRYWGAYVLTSLLGVAAAILVFLYIVNGLNVIGGVDALVTVVINTLPAMVGISMGITLILGNFSAQALYVPLQLSMGDTRKSCYWGYLGYRAAAIAVAVLVSLPAMLLSGEDGIGVDALPALVLALALVSGLGSLMGLAWMKLKAVGVIFMVLVCGTFGGVLGFCSVDDGALGAIQSLVQKLHGGTGVLAVLAIVVVALDLGLGWLSLRRREVKL